MMFLDPFSLATVAQLAKPFPKLFGDQFQKRYYTKWVKRSLEAKPRGFKALTPKSCAILSADVFQPLFARRWAICMFLSDMHYLFARSIASDPKARHTVLNVPLSKPAIERRCPLCFRVQNPRPPAPSASETDDVEETDEREGEKAAPAVQSGSEQSEQEEKKNNSAMVQFQVLRLRGIEDPRAPKVLFHCGCADDLLVADKELVDHFGITAQQLQTKIPSFSDGRPVFFAYEAAAVAFSMGAGLPGPTELTERTLKRFMNLPRGWTARFTLNSRFQRHRGASGSPAKVEQGISGIQRFTMKPRPPELLSAPFDILAPSRISMPSVHVEFDPIEVIGDLLKLTGHYPSVERHFTGEMNLSNIVVPGMETKSAWIRTIPFPTPSVPAINVSASFSPPVSPPDSQGSGSQSESEGGSGSQPRTRSVFKFAHLLPVNS